MIFIESIANVSYVCSILVCAVFYIFSILVCACFLYIFNTCVSGGKQEVTHAGRRSIEQIPLSPVRGVG